VGDKKNCQMALGLGMGWQCRQEPEENFQQIALGARDVRAYLIATRCLGVGF
jgi:hypothetical protein